MGIEELYLHDIRDQMDRLSTYNPDVLLEWNRVPHRSWGDYQTYCSLRARANLVSSGLINFFDEEVERAFLDYRGEGDVYDEPEAFVNARAGMEDDESYWNTYEAEWPDSSSAAWMYDQPSIRENQPVIDLIIAQTERRPTLIEITRKEPPAGHLFDPEK